MKCDVFISVCVYPFFAGVDGHRCSESSTLLEKYKIGKVIGDGNFAVVKECMDRWEKILAWSLTHTFLLWNLFSPEWREGLLKDSTLGTSGLHAHRQLDCSPPGSSVPGISRQEYQSGFMPFSRGSSWPSNQTRISLIAGILYCLSHQRSPSHNINQILLGFLMSL